MSSGVPTEPNRRFLENLTLNAKHGLNRMGDGNGRLVAFSAGCSSLALQEFTEPLVPKTARISSML
jgi:hypothetical protein